MAPTRKPSAEPSRRSERQQASKLLKAAERENAVMSGAVTKPEPKRFRRPRQRKSCFLLSKLPGEIRNYIYRHVLVDPKGIKVYAHGPGEPSLLRVCKSIRNEGRSVYYSENQFSLQIRDYNGAEFAAFASQYTFFEHMVTDKSNIIFNISGFANWTNLVEWIKQDHNGIAMMPCVEPLQSPSEFVVSGAFKLAEQFRFWPWTTLEKALTSYRLGLQGTCSPWGRDDH